MTDDKKIHPTHFQVPEMPWKKESTNNDDGEIIIIKSDKEIEGGCNQSIYHKGIIYSISFRTGSYGITVRLCEDCLNKLELELLKELSKKKPIEILDECTAKITKLEALASSMLSTLETYGLTFRCPKCGTYHSEGHRCFSCGFDHTAQE